MSHTQTRSLTVADTLTHQRASTRCHPDPLTHSFLQHSHKPLGSPVQPLSSPSGPGLPNPKSHRKLGQERERESAGGAGRSSEPGILGPSWGLPPPPALTARGWKEKLPELSAQPASLSRLSRSRAGAHGEGGGGDGGAEEKGRGIRGPAPHTSPLPRGGPGRGGGRGTEGAGGAPGSGAQLWGCSSGGGTSPPSSPALSAVQRVRLSRNSCMMRVLSL